MVKTVAQLQDIDSSLEFSLPAFTYLPKITVSNTQITNRAQVTNFAADGLPKFGIDRIMVQQLIEVQNERGASGERVWKPVNDIHDQMRFVGNWFSGNDNIGQYVGDQNLTFDYCEITFYGTGLNLLVRPTGTYNYSVDGGSESSAGNPSAFAGVLSGRNYSINHIFPIVSGLSVGIHTVKIRNTSGGSGARIYGFEVLNTSSTIFLPTTTSFRGGSRLYSGSTGTTAYNSGFESGTLGTRGGHVLVYQKENGAIAKAVTPTNTSAAYLASADHTNEEVARVYHWREFGAGRTDDFSIVTGGPVNRAFTLDDGTTTLVGVQIDVAISIGDLLRLGTGLGYITITFIGTGLDWVCREDNTGTRDTLALTVDGVSQGNLPAGAVAAERVEKLCSGLPYGTHTVKILLSSVGTVRTSVKQFIVYVPRKPTLPTNAVALADYFVMADFAASTGDFTTFSSGVLIKTPVRELVYSGTWTISLPATNIPTGGYVATGTATDYFEYTFCGTGIEIPITYTASPSPITVQLDGVAYTGSAVITNGGVWTSGTSTITLAGVGNLFRITGLTFGVHKIRLTKSVSADSMRICGAYVITPIHAPKLNGPFVVQNTLAIGSCAVGDLRNFGEQQTSKQNVVSQAVGVASSPFTTSIVFTPVTDMSVVVNTTGKPIIIQWQAVARNNTIGGACLFQIFVDGIAVPNSQASVDQAVANYNNTVGSSVVVPVTAGVHKIDVYWATSSGHSLNVISVQRILTVRELV